MEETIFFFSDFRSTHDDPEKTMGVNWLGILCGLGGGKGDKIKKPGWWRVYMPVLRIYSYLIILSSFFLSGAQPVAKVFTLSDLLGQSHGHACLPPSPPGTCLHFYRT